MISYTPRFSFVFRMFLAMVLATGTSAAIAGDAASESSPSDAVPVGLMLTWQQDPTTTMTIDWHTEVAVTDPAVRYRMDGTLEWQTAAASSRPFPFSERVVHRIELTDLAPDAVYEFRLGADSQAYRFRTMPVSASRPVRFAAGGDVRHRKEWMEQTNRQVLAYDPDFVIFGGDLAYADGLQERVDHWYEWFDALMNTLVTEDGRVIPILASLGNHEVVGGYHMNDEHREGMPPYTQDDESRARIAPYFFALFAMPGQPGYSVLDFGDYMSVILLDTDHANPIDGEQTAWLESVLAERQNVPHVFPVYHVPAYPSVRNFEGHFSARVREYWVPLFEAYGVRTVFENHDHAYKRTHPIRNNEISSDGIVYIGDGAWGVNTREIGREHEQEAWYLDRGESVRHFILGTIHGPHQHFLMVDEDGKVFDEYPSTPHTVLHRYPAEEAVLQD